MLPLAQRRIGKMLFSSHCSDAVFLCRPLPTTG
jgi:hypothetical protein